jgi:rhodanese-related sulfurtransferase
MKLFNNNKNVISFLTTVMLLKNVIVNVVVVVDANPTYVCDDIGDFSKEPGTSGGPCSAWGNPLDPNGGFDKFVAYRDYCCPKDSEPNIAARLDIEDGLLNPCCFVTPPLTRISAEQAFDAYQRQELNGDKGVTIIDVRTPDEVYWTGQPMQTNSIRFKGSSPVTPDDYKTMLVAGGVKGSTLTYERNGKKYKNTNIDGITTLDLSPIAFNVPVEFRDAITDENSLNPNFGTGVIDVVEVTKADVLIYYCRSGARSSIGCYWGYCKELVFNLFEKKNYEIDTPNINGLGGFQGTAYKDRYNGYRGYPGRLTKTDLSTATDWMDAGLPIKIGIPGMTIDNYEDLLAGPYACTESSDPYILELPVCNL